MLEHGSVTGILFLGKELFYAEKDIKEKLVSFCQDQRKL
jgi:hypothetical protein